MKPSSAEMPRPLIRPGVQKVILPLLLLFGVQAWLIVGRGERGRDYQLLSLGVAMLAMLVPPVRRLVVWALDALRQPSPRAAALTAVSISVLSAAYLLFTAWRQQHGFYPKVHDEFVYLTQAQLLAQGRLWMPQHPLADFFDTFYMISEPVYAPLYWPGTALLFTSGVWLHLPFWLIPLAMAGASVGLLYRITTELFDGALGLLAAMLLLGVSIFRWQALMAMSAMPILLLGLLLIWAWLRWQRNGRSKWLWIIGALAGWAAITRPADALCLSLPIGIAITLGLRGRPLRVWLASAGRLVAGAIPFLVLQIVFNVGVSGDPLTTPYGSYHARDLPMATYGFPPLDPARRPVSPLPQKQVFHDEWVLPAVRGHTWANVSREFTQRARMTFELAVAQPLLMVLLPLGLTEMFRRRRWVLWIVLPLFFVVYTPWTFFLPYYCMVAVPAIVLMTIGAVDAIRRILPDRPAVPAAAWLATAVLAIAALPEFDRWLQDEQLPLMTMAEVAKLPERVSGPAIVLFRWAEGATPHEEPVYNPDVAWPDDAPIIKAHDLGERNVELFRYYAARQPQRRVYRYDRGDGSLTDLGMVGELVPSR